MMTDEEWERESFRNHLAVLLRKAYYDARKNGKRMTHDEQEFEENEDINLRLLLDDIMKRRYKPSRGTVHIVNKPVKREIFAAPFRDRIVHHLIYNLVYPWWDRHFIYDSYSCRVGKGMKMGYDRLDYHIRSASLNYARPVCIVKLDIQGFFMSMSRARLLELAIRGLKKQYMVKLDSEEYKMLKFLWTQIIMDDPVKGVRVVGKRSEWDDLPPEKSLFNQPPGVGIVIGNLTSQLLSNIFLNELDRFVKYRLGYKHYGRYVDDFYIVVTAEQLPQALRDVKAIEVFLKSMGAKLHPKKRVVVSDAQGVEFLGAYVHRGYILPGKRVTKNFRQACKDVESGARDVSSVVSYMGHVKHFRHKKFTAKAFDAAAWEYRY